MNFGKIKTGDLTTQALLASVYVALCFAFAPISFGAIQFRVAEMLVPLAFYNKKHTIGLTIGCVIGNFWSPLGLPDIFFGAFATFLVCVLVSRLKNVMFVPIVAAIINGVVVGTMLYFVTGWPIVFAIPSVFAGEAISVFAGVFAISAIRATTSLKHNK